MHCQCRDVSEEPSGFSALTLEGGVEPKLAYVTAKFADLIDESQPYGGAVNAGTVRNRPPESASV